MDGSSRQALLSRRNLLTVGAISTGAVWVAPIVTGINMVSAHAASGAADRARPGGPGRPGKDSNWGGGNKPTTRPGRPTTEPVPPGITDRPVPGVPYGRGNNISRGGGSNPITLPGRTTSKAAPPVTKDRSGGLAKTGEPGPA